MTGSVLDINDLVVGLGRNPHAQRIIDGVSLKVSDGETLCLVGESGSGKSVTSLTVMGLLQKGSLAPTARQHQAGRRRTARRQRPAAAAVARHHHGDDFPGADDGAQSGGAGRPPDRRGAARSHRPRCPRAPQPHSCHDGAGPAARGRTHLRVLPAPAVWRPAPAHHDRDGIGAGAEIADCGRTHHGARRHHPEANSDLDPRSAAGSRYRRAVHHP